MEEVDINVLRKILTYYIYTIIHKHKGVKSSVLSLRTVNKQWKRAVEGVDEIWSMIFGTIKITEHSRHLTHITCTGIKLRKFNDMAHCANTTYKVTCNIPRHFNHLAFTRKITFSSMFGKKRKRVEKRLTKLLKLAKMELEQVEKEMKYLK